MILLSHPFGNANIRQTALALQSAGLLDEFWTCLNWPQEAKINRWLPTRFRQELQRRSFPPSLKGRVHTWPERELGRQFLSRVWPGSPLAGPGGIFSVDAIFQDLDVRVARRLREHKGVRGVYAVEDGALESFRVAQKMGIKRLYELPIGYWRAAQNLYREEAEREPEWATTLTGTADSMVKLERKDEELRLAQVVYAASSFTRKTLELAPNPPQQVEVIPLGGPEPLPALPVRRSSSGRLRVLYVGSLDQRKGLSYMFEAVVAMKSRVELTLIGVKGVRPCSRLEQELPRHHWLGSLPHARVLEQMQQHDVLLFPSLFEGFGLVILEAMSQGLPVIATSHTAGADIITDGRDGFLIPIRDAAAIQKVLEQLQTQPELLQGMRQEAWQTVRRHGWERFRDRFIVSVSAVLGGASS